LLSEKAKLRPFYKRLDSDLFKRVRNDMTQRHVDAFISPMDLNCHSREKVAATWTQFKEEVEKLFCEKYHMQCGDSYEESAVLVSKFADLMEDGFGDKEGADTARSELIDEINEAIDDRAYFEELSNAWWGNRL